MTSHPAPIILITGTDTGVGKTITTAAIAATLAAAGRSVAIDKPTQTGVLPNQPGDVDEITRLTGIRTTSEGIRLIAAMAPIPAAAREQRTLPTLEDHVTRIQAVSRRHDHVLVEGAGGLLVQITNTGHTIADLAHALTPTPDLIVVTRAGLGTLNHTQLTIEAITRRGLTTTALVIGDWPAAPGPTEHSNYAHLASNNTPVFGRIPHGAARLPRRTFRTHAPTWLPKPTS